MSAQMFDPHNPFSSQAGGQYDPGALQGLYLRAQKGDLSARKYLQQIGVLGNQGQDIWANNDTQAGNFAPAINAWAQSTGSTPYGGPGFAFQPQWATANNDPNFSRTWDTWFQTGGQGTDFTPADWKPQPNPLYDNNGTASHTPPAGQPAASSSPYGYTYTAPPNLNAWGTYDGGRGYQGGDGVYNPQKDSAKGWGPNGQTELDRDRVWRMTLDELKGNRDPAAVQAAYLDNIARLHRDYVNTPELGAQAWANSAFAGYDQYLAGGGAATQGGGQRGGQAVTNPATGPGTSPPVPGQPPANTPPPTTYKDPITGQTQTYTGSADASTLAKNVALADSQNGDTRLSYIMRQYGIDPTRGGLYTASLARALSPQIEAYNQTRGLLNGVGGGTPYDYIDNTTGDLNSFAQQLAGPGGFGQIQQQARATLGDPRFSQLAGSYTDPQTIDVMQTLLSQAYAGANPLYNQARMNQFQSAFGPGGEYAMYSLDHPQTGAPGYQHPLQWLQGTPWANLLAGY